jgi:hypothetical protein
VFKLCTTNVARPAWFMDLKLTGVNSALPAGVDDNVDDNSEE